MEKTRFITLIKNEKGLDEYDHGIFDTDNNIQYEFDNREFEILCEKGVFREINEKCDLMIDDFEDEIIEHNNLQICVDIMEKVSKKFEVVRLFREALKSGEHSAIAFDF